MCTAVSFNAKYHYFGRNLDYEHSFDEKITITPRKYSFKFRNKMELDEHYAIIGMSVPLDNYPLYFDATNEKGLSMAGLNFPNNAFYIKNIENKINVASFEFIPYVLSQCKSVLEARNIIEEINITDEWYSDNIPPSSLHWMISDKNSSITVEQTLDGMKIYDNPIGVLTNNPMFEIQLSNLNNYMSLSSKEPQNMFSEKVKLKPISRGMGAMGLPGDLSSQSRFVRAAFVKLNSVCGDSEAEAVNQFLHILYSVAQQRGCVKIGEEYEITNYTSCCNTDKGIYYYTTYNNLSVSKVDMYKENLDDKQLKVFDLKYDWEYFNQN